MSGRFRVDFCKNNMAVSKEKGVLYRESLAGPLYRELLTGPLLKGFGCDVRQVKIYGCSYKLGVLFVGVFFKNLLVGLHIWALDFWKLPKRTQHNG